LSVYLRKYAVATTIDFSLYKLDGTGLKTDAASATGDITLYRNEGNVETLDADAFTDEGAIYSLALSEAEMTAARIIIAIVDQSSPQVWLDKTLIVETYGNASAMHVFDLGTAVQSVNLTQIGGVAQSATDLKDFADTGYDPAAHRADAVVKAQDNIDFGALQKTSLSAATPAVTVSDKTGFALSATGVDAILDEVVEGTTTLRKAVNIHTAVLACKASGGGTDTLVYRDVADSKPRVTLTVDADGNRSAATLDGA
jgi:hypothetical protein